MHPGRRCAARAPGHSCDLGLSHFLFSPLDTVSMQSVLLDALCLKSPKSRVLGVGAASLKAAFAHTICLRSPTLFGKSQILLCQAGSALEKSYPREYVVKMCEVQVMGAC